MTSSSIELSSNTSITINSIVNTNTNTNTTTGNIIAKTMQTALTTNIAVSDVIIYNSIVDSAIKTGLTALADSSADTNSNTNTNTNSTSSSSNSNTLTVADKENIQNLYESYVDSIGVMSMKAVMSGQVPSLLLLTSPSSLSLSLLLE